MKGGKQNSTTCTQRGKTKATKRGSVTKVTHSSRNIHLPQPLQSLNIYRQLWLCPRSSKRTNTQILIMFNLEGIMTLMAHILCNIHIWPPIVWEPTNPQNCLFSIVCSVIFSPPAPFSFLSHSSQHPQKRVAPRTTDCFTVKAIVGRPNCTGNSFAFPFPENISP